MRFIGYGDLLSHWDALTDGSITPKDEFLNIGGLERMSCIVEICDFVSDFDVNKSAHENRPLAGGELRQ